MSADVLSTTKATWVYGGAGVHGSIVTMLWVGFPAEISAFATVSKIPCGLPILPHIHQIPRAVSSGLK
jgi:hypothetical protein